MEPVVYTKNAEKLEAVKMKAQKSVKSLFNCALESYLDNITLQEKIPKYLITSLESLPPTLLLPVLEMVSLYIAIKLLTVSRIYICLIQNVGLNESSNILNYIKVCQHIA